MSGKSYVYVVIKGQGQYDERRDDNIKCFIDETKANAYKDRITSVFSTMYKEYDGLVGNDTFEEVLSYSDEKYEIYSEYLNKRNKFDGCSFYIEKLQII